jgi:hypothetical protein
MATIKAYTTIEQSRKLADILSLESADMFYPTNSDWEGKIIGLLDVPLYIGSDGFVDTEMGEIHAWSLAALLGVLPKSLIYTPNPALDGYCCKNIMHDLETYGENPVDACYEMIIKLKERNLL